MSHDDDLDFERADFSDEAMAREQRSGTPAPGPIGCSLCQLEIADCYFTKNQAFVCASCEGPERLAGPPGSALSRALGAIAAGSLAAALASAVWMTVTRLTGYEIGLIAIAVGWVVGLAVSIGNRGIGGLPYQFLASFLAYSAIVMTYVPMVAHELQTNPFDAQSNRPDYRLLSPEANGELKKGLAEESNNTPGNAANQAFTGSPGKSENPGTAFDQPGHTLPSEDRNTALIAWALAIPIAYAMPFLSGFENVIGLLIIGFGLYQAWSMTAKREIVWEGPFRVGSNPGT